jgi:hypothetical protein
MEVLRNLGGTAAVLAASSLALAASVGAATTQTAGISPTVRAALLERALQNAAIHGDPHPYDIEAVRTTHQKAGSLTGETSSKPSGATPVYVVAMRGHFKCRCAPPPGDHIPAPKGSVITFEIIANTPELETGIQWSIGGRYTRLQSIGTPVHLQAPNAN